MRHGHPPATLAQSGRPLIRFSWQSPGACQPGACLPLSTKRHIHLTVRQLAVEPVARSEIAELCAREPLISWRLLSSLPLDRKAAEPRPPESSRRTARSPWRRSVACMAAARSRRENREAIDPSHRSQPCWWRSWPCTWRSKPVIAHRRTPTCRPLAINWRPCGEDLQARRRKNCPTGDAQARLAARAHLSPPVLDAIQLGGALEEHVEHSHTLVRLLWVALQLTRDDPQQRLETLSRIARSPESTLRSRRCRVSGRRRNTSFRRRDETSAVLDTTDLQGTSIDDPWVDAATRACIRAAFGSLGTARLPRGCGCRQPPDLRQERAETGLGGAEQTGPATTGEARRQWLRVSSCAFDDETSCLRALHFTCLAVTTPRATAGPGAQSTGSSIAGSAARVSWVCRGKAKASRRGTVRTRPP